MPWGPDPVTLAYQWYRSGSAISDATGATYKARTADAGQTITVKVTGSKPGYATAAKTSVGTAAIAKGTLTSPVPTITGTAAAGSTLTAVPGDWGPAPVGPDVPVVPLGYRDHRRQRHGPCLYARRR